MNSVKDTMLRLAFVRTTVYCAYGAILALLAGCGMREPVKEPQTATEAFKVSFNAQGGNFAVGKDADGNQYTFRAKEANGEMRIMEANVQLGNGDTLKANLDKDGRPVNFRLSSGANADVYYSGDDAIVLFTDANGNQKQGQVNKRTSKGHHTLFKQRVAWQSNPSAGTERLRTGLTTYAELVDVLFNSPQSPLANTPLRDGAVLCADVAVALDVVEVAKNELADVTADEMPAVVQSLASRTFKLFDAEGLCPEITGVASILAFDAFGILQSENDRHVVFPDFGAAQNRNSDVFINYATGAPINLNPGDTEVQIVLGPVFTGTGVDNSGRIVVERRFEAATTFDILSPVTGFAQSVTAVQLFDAALLNGTFSQNGSVIEFDLVLIDLQDSNEPRRVGRLRYHDQNSIPPAPVFTCITGEGGGSLSGILCPGTAEVQKPFAVSFVPSSADIGKTFQFDWFVADGFGRIQGSPFGQDVQVVGTASGVVTVVLILSEVSAATGQVIGMFQVFTCDILIGDMPVGAAPGSSPAHGPVQLTCTTQLSVGETGLFHVSGSGVEDFALTDWLVFGTSNVYVDAPYDSSATGMTFLSAGVYDVAFAGTLKDNSLYLDFCQVTVKSGNSDLCAELGYYGDGEYCDLFCPLPDPDCGDVDPCAEYGYYSDGECDDFCAMPDPDCEGGDGNDPCAEYGYYSDGECDDFCLLPDPDCSNGGPMPPNGDVCQQSGYYGDGEYCDLICPQPDPDCLAGLPVFDYCELFGAYGNGVCDQFCAFPDPDCGGGLPGGGTPGGGGFPGSGAPGGGGLPGGGIPGGGQPGGGGNVPGGFDPCAQLGYYGDGKCQPYCPNPDPDCAGGLPYDTCAANGWYGDGACDGGCLYLDTDCLVNGTGKGGGPNPGVVTGDGGNDGDPNSDVCAQLGTYGNGWCDYGCDLPDPDCVNPLGEDLCEIFNMYGNYSCESGCPQFDPDCF